MEELRLATFIFKHEHQYLPGDFPHASLHWGIQACVAAGATATYGANGNGIIEGGHRSATTGVHDKINESYAAWCHLYQAGLIKQHTVPLDNNTTTPIVGKHIPASKFGKGSGYIIAAFWLGYPLQTSGNRPDNITLAKPGVPMWNHTPILNPKQAYAIDKKVDDGKPNSGLYRVSEKTTAACLVSGNNEYNIAGTKDPVCTIAVIVE
jgi:hypothetical protein